MKWKKPSRPEGVAVWMHGGNLCMADVLKKAVRLTFPDGAALSDPAGLFNTRLDSKSVRAIEGQWIRRSGSPGRYSRVPRKSIPAPASPPCCALAS